MGHDGFDLGDGLGDGFAQNAAAVGGDEDTSAKTVEAFFKENL